MARRDDVIVRVGADDTRFRKAMRRVQKTTKDVAANLGKTGQAISGFFTRTLPGAIAGTGTALLALSRQAFDFGDEIAKVSDKLGISTDALQEWRYMAESAGVSQNQLQQALQRFIRQLGQAQQGKGKLLKELDRLRISLRDASTGEFRDAMDVLYDYSEAIAATESETEKLRLAYVGFESEGVGLVNIANQGAAAMREQARAAHDLGLVMDESAVRSSERFTQRWDEMSNKWSVTWRSWLIEMWEWLEKISDTSEKYEDLQERLIKNFEQQAIVQEKIARGGAFEDANKGHLALLQEQNKAILGQIKNLKDLERQRNRSSVAASSGEGATGGTGGKASRGAGPAADEDWRVKSPEEINAALQAFRSGQISAAELGERTGLQPPGTAEGTLPGAYGTESNRARGAADLGSDQVAALWAQNAANMLQAEIDKVLALDYAIKLRPEVIGLQPADALDETSDVEGERMHVSSGGY